jgi:hypothetical protein
MPNSSKRSLSFRFSNQNLVTITHVSHMCHTLRPYYSPVWHAHLNNAYNPQLCWLVNFITAQPPSSRYLGRTIHNPFNSIDLHTWWGNRLSLFQYHPTTSEWTNN